METCWVYLKDYVQSWEINRQCPLYVPVFTLTWPMSPAHLPKHLWASNRQDLRSLHRPASPKEKVWSAFFPGDFVYSSPCFSYQPIPVSIASSYFLPRKNEKIKLQVCFAQISLKGRKVLRFTKMACKMHLGKLTFSQVGSAFTRCSPLTSQRQKQLTCICSQK